MELHKIKYVIVFLVLGITNRILGISINHLVIPAKRQVIPKIYVIFIMLSTYLRTSITEAHELLINQLLTDQRTKSGN